MTGAPTILAIDQGTSSTKVLLVDGDGRTVARAVRPVGLGFPQPGWVEQDPEDLWTSTLDAIEACLAEVPGTALTAVAISNQRESMLAWDRASGAALGPCISWQCQRSMSICEDLRARGLAARIEEATGLPLAPLFSAAKARWLLDNLPDGRSRAEAGEICLGTVDSWLLWKLTGGSVHATDLSNASRTQLVELGQADWSTELLSLFELPREALPQIRDSAGQFGETVQHRTLPAGIPIMGVAGDSHAAMFAHAKFQPGAIKATFGTGSSLMALIPSAIGGEDGLARTVAWKIGPEPSLALEGNIASTGGTIEWLGRLLGMADPANEVAALATQVSEADGVSIVPAFAGLGAPHWDDQARALISGLTHGSTKAHLARAAIESIAFQVRDVFDAMQAALGMPLSELLADGGASRNDTLMQFQADILGRRVVRDRSADLSAIGAAWLAGLACAMWTLNDLETRPRAVDCFEPAMDEAKRNRLYADWQNAVARARFHPSREDPAG